MALTPTIGLKGRYTLAAPYDTLVLPTGLYECIAVRKFEDLLVLTVDVFADYYEPYGLLQSDYQADNRNGASIVTFVDVNDNYVYVPDTYILSIPSMDNVAYQHVVISLSLGPFPEYVGLTDLSTKLKELTETTIGVDTTPLVHVAPTRNVMPSALHEGMEVARTNRIVGSQTERAKRIALEAQLVAARAEIAALQQILVDNGLVVDVPD
jgi:hypothetical protein